GIRDWSVTGVQTCALPIFREVALMAVWKSEMLAELGDPVKLVFRQIFGQPVAPVIREIEFLCHRVPIEAHRIAHPAGGHLGAARSEEHTSELQSLTNLVCR